MFIFRFLGKLLRAIWLGLNTLRRVLHLILLLVIFGALLAALVGQPRPVPSRAALVLDPTGELVEQLAGSPLDRALAELNQEEEPQTLVRDLTDSLDRAIDDERIQAVVLNLDGLQSGGLASLQAIGERLDAVRASGKRVVAVGSAFTRDQYYLASRADEVIMSDLGLVYLEGYEYFRAFFRSALDSLKVDLNVFRVGEYKSFVEPFIRDTMSEEDKLAARRWVGALWSAWERDVATARKLDPARLSAYANDLAGQMEASGGDAARAAVGAGLVDRLMGRPEFDAYMTELVGESSLDPGNYSAIDFRSYLRATALEARLLQTRADNVAVIVAAGEIVDGEAPPGTVGGDTLAAEIRQARFDDSIAAVVLRVDSPGGSMFASEVVFDELAALKADGKPLVASMGSVAASGGYYIAMPADEIWSGATTITGSIGVGALVPTVQRSLDALGIHVDGFGTTRMSGQLRLDRPLGEDARRVLTAGVEDAYRVFVGKVAEARKLSPEEAEKLAQGRVWIGSDALDLKLVDHIGGLDQAVQSAAKRAGLAEGSYGTIYMEPPMTLRERLALELGVRAVRLLSALGLAPQQGWLSAGWLKQASRALDAQVGLLSRLNDPRGIYYHCFCGVN
jgi:protease-4